LVVEMRDGEFPMVPRRERMKSLQQHHRIQSARNRHQDGLTAFQQTPAPNVLFDALKQIGHNAMLLHWRN